MYTKAICALLSLALLALALLARAAPISLDATGLLATAPEQVSDPIYSIYEEGVDTIAEARTVNQDIQQDEEGNYNSTMRHLPIDSEDILGSLLGKRIMRIVRLTREELQHARTPEIEGKEEGQTQTVAALEGQRGSDALKAVLIAAMKRKQKSADFWLNGRTGVRLTRN